MCICFFSAHFWFAAATGTSVQQRDWNWCWPVPKNLIQLYKIYKFSCVFLSPHWCPLHFCILSLIFFILFLHWSKTLVYPCSCSFLAISSNTTLFLTAPSIQLILYISLSTQMAIRALTSLSDHKLSRVALEAIVVYFDLKVNPLTIRVSSLHACASRLIQIQSSSNPHPEVGYVIQIPMRVSAFARTWISLIRIPTRVKGCV